MLKAKGASIYDGVSSGDNERKYSDLVPDYVRSKLRSAYEDGGYDWKLCTVLLFTALHSEPESADCIRKTLKKECKT